MRKVELVRCALTGPREPGNRAVRYVPAEIFELWKHLMEHRHGFAVEPEVFSFWFDGATYAARKETFPAHAAEEVVELRFHYPGTAPAGREVLRYFPAAEYDAIRRYMDAHFEPARREDIVETAGVFVVPR